MAAAGKPESENKPYSCLFVAAKMAPWARSSPAASSVGKGDVCEGFLMSSVASRVSTAVYCHVTQPSFLPLQDPQQKNAQNIHISAPLAGVSVSNVEQLTERHNPAGRRIFAFYLWNSTSVNGPIWRGSRSSALTYMLTKLSAIGRHPTPVTGPSRLPEEIKYQAISLGWILTNIYAGLTFDPLFGEN